MATRDERKAENESFFREVNERLERVAIAKASGAERFEIICECAVEECTQRLSVSFAAYEAVRSVPTRFLVAHGHADARVERVVESTEGYEVVQKVGEAGAVAGADDPRGET